MFATTSSRLFHPSRPISSPSSSSTLVRYLKNTRTSSLSPFSTYTARTKYPNKTNTLLPKAKGLRAFSSSPVPQFKHTSAKMAITEIKSRSSFNDAVGSSEKLVVIDCFAEWCGPCKAIAPKIEEYSQTYSDVSFYKVDVDEVTDVAQELGVRAMPTFFFFKNGQKVDEVLGAAPPAIQAAIEKHKS